MGKVPRMVVTGVSGAGKTCIAGALAQRLAVEYADGDAFHSPENRAKMAAGKPLEDADRWPWLEAIGDYLAQRATHGAVVSCSALRRRYRDVLRCAAPDLVLVHLDGDPRLIERRLAARRGHFMPPSLLASQISTLEPLQPDERGIASAAPAAAEHCVLWTDAAKAAYAPRLLRDCAALLADAGAAAALVRTSTRARTWV